MKIIDVKWILPFPIMHSPFIEDNHKEIVITNMATSL